MLSYSFFFKILRTLLYLAWPPLKKNFLLRHYVNVKHKETGRT